ncbi:MAG: roadblock/LC7 domain-containing protein [Candidatus Helarchaeota archaeon]|jgi:predicted regulator of Ras-like GTPase activity (Roadblock/LC7/MglB family)|nr:roadblock/LC7 domain-containing protein [Candidatus Helarchaeota archaeon]
MNKVEDAKKVLRDLETKVPDIVGSAVIRTNGLLIVSALPSESNERMVAAMSAALLGTSKRTAEALFNGTFKSLSLEIDKGNMFLIGAGRVILVALTNKEPNIGLVTLEMEDVSKKIGNLFQLEE